MSVPIAQATIDRSVVPTIYLFGFYVLILTKNATAIFNEVSGLTPPSGQSYGRYYASGNPLVPFSLSASSLTTLIAQANLLRAAVVDAINDAVHVIRTEPLSAIVPAIYGVVTALEACSATPQDQINTMMVLAGFQPPTSLRPGADEIGLEMTDLANLTARLIRIAALHSLARATAAYKPNSQNDAISLRNVVSAMLINEMTVAATLFDDADYTAMNADRLAVSIDLNARGSQLAPVVTKSFPVNLPSLALAYRLYQTANMEPDLVARNNPVHPGWMQLDIECLTESNI